MYLRYLDLRSLASSSLSLKKLKRAKRAKRAKRLELLPRIVPSFSGSARFRLLRNPNSLPTGRNLESCIGRLLPCIFHPECAAFRRRHLRLQVQVASPGCVEAPAAAASSSKSRIAQHSHPHPQEGNRLAPPSLTTVTHRHTTSSPQATICGFCTSPHFLDTSTILPMPASLLTGAALLSSLFPRRLPTPAESAIQVALAKGPRDHEPRTGPRHKPTHHKTTTICLHRPRYSFVPIATAPPPQVTGYKGNAVTTHFASGRVPY